MKISTKALRLGIGIALAAGLCSALPQTVLAGPWLKLESANFVIYTDGTPKSVSETLARMETYELVVDALFQKLGDSYYPIKRKTEFYYLNTVDEFRFVQPDIPDNAFRPAVGCPANYPQYYSINQGIHERGDDKFIDPSLAYLMRSYTFVKINQYFDYPLPTWVQTGLSDYFMTLNITPDAIKVGLPLPALTSSALSDPSAHDVAFADIVSGHLPKDADQDQIRLQQWVMINYFLTSVDHRKLFLNYLGRIKTGQDSLSAFTAATGMQPDAFKVIYKSYLSKGAPYLTYPGIGTTPPEITATTLPAYDDRTPLIRSALQLCHDAKRGAALLQKAEASAAKFPADPLSRITRDRAEIMRGDPNIAIASLTETVAHEPENQEAQFLLGLAYLTLARLPETDARRKTDAATLYRQARAELGKAYTLDPSSGPTLVYFAQANENLPNYPDDNTLKAAELADDLPGGDTLYLAKLYVMKRDLPAALAVFKKRSDPGRKATPAVKAAYDALVAQLSAAGGADTPSAILDGLEKYKALISK